MQIVQIYKNLGPKGRLGLGVGLLAWGCIGLAVTPTIEEKLGLVPTEADKEKLDKLLPKIHVIPRDSKS
ncbi:hypothetical protein VTJ04DRAFT_4554 [Mycothermus thermophilus]|uniref:uncharacterized protein n=1 Tax=Humicola insolens TaxID=85995 RepID=UPI0037432E21